LRCHRSTGRDCHRSTVTLDAVQLLTDTGCPQHTAAGKGARDAVQIALAGGWTGAEIYDHIADWFDYVDSTEGIRHKGLFTAARIRNLEPAPPPRPKTADDYIVEVYDRIVRHPSPAGGRGVGRSDGTG